MLASQTALPPLHRYIQVKNQGSVTHRIDDSASADPCASGPLAGRGTTSSPSPVSAIRMRSGRLS